MKANKILRWLEGVSPNLMMNFSRQEFSICSQIPVINTIYKNYIAEDASFEKDDESYCVTEINFFLFNLSSESSYKFAYSNQDPAG